MTQEPLNISEPQITYERFSLNGYQVDTSKIVEVEIEEQLDYPGITGRVVLQDFDDIKLQTQLIGYDEINLHMKIREQNFHFSGTNFIVSNGHGDIITTVDTSIHNAIAVNFETRWSVNAFTMKMTKAYTKSNSVDGEGWKISDIVKDLVETCGGVPNDEMWIETEGTIERFITPKWTIMESLNYLMSIAIRKQEDATEDHTSGAYVLWTNIKENPGGGNWINFAPLDFLMQDDDNYTTNDETLSRNEFEEASVLSTKVPDQHSIYRIHNIEVMQSFDAAIIADTGVANSTTMGFDFDKGVALPIRNVAGGDEPFQQWRLSEGFPVRKFLLHDNFGTLKSAFDYPNTNTVIAPDGTKDYDTDLMTKGKAATKTSLLMADMLKLNILTEGDPETKKIGRQIQIIVPKAESGDAKDPQLSGRYLVKENVHVIKRKFYSNSIVVVREGYNNFQNENALTWDSQEQTDEDFDKASKSDLENLDISEGPGFII